MNFNEKLKVNIIKMLIKYGKNTNIKQIYVLFKTMQAHNYLICVSNLIELKKNTKTKNTQIKINKRKNSHQIYQNDYNHIIKILQKTIIEHGKKSDSKIINKYYLFAMYSILIY